MPRSQRRFLLLTAVVMVAFAVITPPRADAADDNAVAEAAIPYLRSTQVELPEGWVATACPDGPPVDLVDIVCDRNQIMLTALGYDPDSEPREVTIAATTAAGLPQRMTYTVTLEPPVIGTGVSGPYGYPLGGGTHTVLPYSELGYVCESCEETGPVFVAGDVEPAGAADVAFSGLGLVLRPSADFAGDLTVSYTVRDRYGQVSEPAQLTLTLFSGQNKAPVTLPDTATTTNSVAVEGNVLDNDVVDSRYPAEVLACGSPANGTVTCEPDGSYEYRPRADFSGLDQFSYHTVTPTTGDQAVGIVLVGVDADPLPVLDRAAGPEATNPMAPPRPLSPQEQARQSGVLTVLWDALTALGGTA